MIWLGGAVKEPMVIDTYANQTDLAATLLYQLNLPHDSFIFSRDILDPGSPKYAFYTFPTGAFFAFMNYVPNATFATAALTEMIYCTIGLLFGYITICLRSAYEKKVSEDAE